MEITSHSVSTPIVKIDGKSGLLEIARMTYLIESEGKTSIRHITEGGKNGQSILETLLNGVFSEARGGRVFAMKILSPTPILVRCGPDEYHPGGIHLKVAFPVYVPEQCLRTFETVDRDDPDEVLGPLKMVTAEDWLCEIEEKGTVPFHLLATKAVLTWAAVDNPKVCERYFDIIRGWKPKELTDEQRAAVAAYPKRW
ncbi:MAG: hypothetical protein HYX23_00250 [Candidatus Zambryskibacteria bacterium]|nr:hypothetical protein [Candidatus Zambryskibacteria bacterium]